MDRISVAQARKVEAVGRQVRLQGWVRTRRDSKGGFSFLELNDGSCLGNVQVIAEAGLPNYQSEVLHLSVGSSVTVEGAVQASPAKGQATEVRASRLVVHGFADPARYPLQKKGHSMEFLRDQAHLRPRSNTFGAVCAVRNQICRSIHDFFQENGFLYIQPPIITGIDCEGAGQMFRVTTLDFTQAAAQRAGRDRFLQGLLRPAHLPDGERPARGRDLRLRPGQGLHLRPDVPRREQQHLAAPGRVLDGRAGNGLLRADRQHGPGRGVPEAHLQGRSGEVRRGHAVLQGPHRADRDQHAGRDRQREVRSPELHRGGRHPA